MSSFFQTFIEPWLLFLAEDPILRALQFCMIGVGVIAVFLVFYATRDILQRTHSFAFMLICIVLVAVLPVVGFLIYLLIRPSQTLKEVEMQELLQRMLDETKKNGKLSSIKKPKNEKSPRGGDDLFTS